MSHVIVSETHMVFDFCCTLKKWYNLHGDPMSVIAGAKLLESAKKFRE